MGFSNPDDHQNRNRRFGTNTRDAYWTERDAMLESMEEEEDYEEFARSRDREYGNRRGGQAAPSGGYGRQAQGAAGRDPRRTGQGHAPEYAGNQDPRRANAGGRTGSGQRPVQREPERMPAKHRRKGGCLGVILRFLLVVIILAAIVGGIVFYKMRDVLELQRVNSVDLEQQIRPGISSQVMNDEMMNGYQNIALFGVDSRSGDLLEGDNRSDTIMIASINEKTGEIRLVSVFRDTILEVGEGYYSKANSAYAIGGPAQAINMLNKNLDMNILDFVTVGFEGLAHTIDALGGIEIEIDEEEREYLNQYVHDMHLELGTEDDPVEQSGLVTLNGIQATAYSRIRYTAGDDFRRAERQRTVLQKTLEKAKGASPTTLVEVANSVVGDMATSLSSSEILGLILKAQSLELVGTGGIPQEEYREFGNTYEEGDYVKPVNLEDNVRWLHAFLFGEENYEISEEASERDEYIRWAF